MRRRRKSDVDHARQRAIGEERYRRWRAALELAGTNQKAWAEARDLTHSHVRQVVLGLRESDRLLPEIMAFIEAQERRPRPSLAAAS